MTGDPARLRLLEFLLWTEHTVGERAGASAPRTERRRIWLAWPTVATREPTASAGSPTTRCRPQVADLLTLARSLAAGNAEMLADRVRIGTTPSPGTTKRNRSGHYIRSQQATVRPQRHPR
jgi:hypothetical protein